MSKRPIRISNSLFAGLAMICVLLPLSSEGNSDKPEEENSEPVTCLLDGGELKLRTAEIFKWIFQNEEVIELEDGCSFRFPGNDEWIHRVIEFIKFERRCCDFMKFKVTFESKSGPIWLYMGGSVEVKNYLETLIK